MQVILKEQGFIVDGEALSYPDIYNLAFDNTPPDDAGLYYLVCVAKRRIVQLWMILLLRS